MKFKVENMTCGGCVKSITRAVQNSDAAAQVDADLQTKIVDIRTVRPETEVAAILAKAGYEAVALR